MIGGNYMMWHEDEQGPVVLPKGSKGVSDGQNWGSLGGNTGTIYVSEYMPRYRSFIGVDFANSTCDHEYINVGFTSITEVCKKCNKEKKLRDK